MTAKLQECLGGSIAPGTNPEQVKELLHATAAQFMNILNAKSLVVTQAPGAGNGSASTVTNSTERRPPPPQPTPPGGSGGQTSENETRGDTDMSKKEEDDLQPTNKTRAIAA